MEPKASFSIKEIHGSVAFEQRHTVSESTHRNRRFLPRRAKDAKPPLNLIDALNTLTLSRGDAVPVNEQPGAALKSRPSWKR
jgi:hypothetical protein